MSGNRRETRHFNQGKQKTMNFSYIYNNNILIKINQEFYFFCSSLPQFFVSVTVWVINHKFQTLDTASFVLSKSIVSEILFIRRITTNPPVPFSAVVPPVP